MNNQYSSYSSVRRLLIWYCYWGAQGAALYLRGFFLSTSAIRNHTNSAYVILPFENAGPLRDAVHHLHHISECVSSKYSYSTRTYRMGTPENIR